MSTLTKPISLAHSSCLVSLASVFTTSSEASSLLSLRPKPIRLFLSSSHSPTFSILETKTHFPSLVSFVSQTSDWAQQEEENDTTITIDGQEQPVQDETESVGESTWENGESDGAEARLSDWEPEGEDAVFQGEGGNSEEDSPPEPPEEAKLFVGNLPFDVDCQSLAMLFEKAGTVEIAEVIYNRQTDQSRGFGFVNMSTIEEAEKAAELFNRYVNLNGRLLTVNRAAPRGSRFDRPHRVYEPAFRIYVGNLPWDVDNGRLEQVFSEHGKVVDARVVYDRETGRSRGFGFLTMSSETELNDAIAALDGQSLDGRAIIVNVAEKRPRRSSF